MPRTFIDEIRGGVKYDDKALYVRRSLSESSAGLALNPCKTIKSRRIIPYDDEMESALKSCPESIYYKKPRKTYPVKYIMHGYYGDIIAPSNWAIRTYKRLKEDFADYAEKTI